MQHVSKKVKDYDRGKERYGRWSQTGITGREERRRGDRADRGCRRNTAEGGNPRNDMNGRAGRGYWHGGEDRVADSG